MLNCKNPAEKAEVLSLQYPLYWRRTAALASVAGVTLLSTSLIKTFLTLAPLRCLIIIPIKFPEYILR